MLGTDRIAHNECTMLHEIQNFNSSIFLPLDRPRKFDERMLDDQDDAHSTHSIGIVENPLYAEQEEYSTPSYAALKKKEVEADVSHYKVPLC